MEEYIDKIKYLKERVKISLEDVNNTDNGELMSKEEVLKSTRTLKKLADENKDEYEIKYNLYIFSSQLLLLEYEDLDKMLKIASEIIIKDNCLLYDTFKNIIDKGE